MTVSVTRLLGLGLTPGKLRGLQRICNDNGTLTMVATDQNSSMISMIKDSLKKKGEEREPTYDEIVEAKITLTRALAPHASAILVDGYYGVWNALATINLPRNVGLLVRVEKSGGDKNDGRRSAGRHRAGLGVSQDQAHAAPTPSSCSPRSSRPSRTAPSTSSTSSSRSTRSARSTTSCMLLETVAFPFDGEKKDDAKYKDRKAETVIESARQLSRFCDIYKAEFPGWLGSDSRQHAEGEPEGAERGERAALGAASRRRRFPGLQASRWQMAVECGASGVLGGRAFWKEYFLQDDQAAREKFATGESANRVKELATIVHEQGDAVVQARTA